MKTKQSLILVGLGISLFSVSCSSQKTVAPASLADNTNQTAVNPRAKSPVGAKVYIIEPKDGATVTSPVHIKFGLEGMKLVPAGAVVDNEGHHHLILDSAELPPLDFVMPSTDKIIHYGKAETEADVALTPGEHSLQLVLAGGNHIAHVPPVISDKIKIKVQ